MSERINKMVIRLETLLRINTDPHVQLIDYTSKNNEIERIVNELVRQGHYPERSRRGISAHDMVRLYGAHWNIYNYPHYCPQCKESWKDLENGPPFKCEIMLSDLQKDGVVAYKCPYCETVFSVGEYNKSRIAQEYSNTD